MLFNINKELTALKDSDPNASWNTDAHTRNAKWAQEKFWPAYKKLEQLQPPYFKLGRTADRKRVDLVLRYLIGKILSGALASLRDDEFCGVSRLGPRAGCALEDIGF